jgi:hypothetical protein
MTDLLLEKDLRDAEEGSEVLPPKEPISRS